MSTLRQRLLMCLAEAGYPNEEWVSLEEEDPSVEMDERGVSGVPERVLWKAFNLATSGSNPCFDCWSIGIGEDCGHRMSVL